MTIFETVLLQGSAQKMQTTFCQQKIPTFHAKTCAQFLFCSVPKCPFKGCRCSTRLRGQKRRQKGELIYNCRYSQNRHNGNRGRTNDLDSVLNFGNSESNIHLTPSLTPVLIQPTTTLLVSMTLFAF